LAVREIDIAVDMPNFGDYWTGTDFHHPKTAAVIKDFISTLSFQSLVDHANSIRDRADCAIDAHRFQCRKTTSFLP
jgi:hypothetical protein